MSTVVGLRPGEPVDWSRLDERTFVRLVEALVQVEYADTAVVEPVDGRGGDGGADIRVRHHDGRVEVLQLKFYPDGFDGKHSGRRRKVEESLGQAVKHQDDMTHWTLVFPAVPTPPGWTFLRSLAERHADTVAVGWLLRSHLDALCSRHPSVVTSVARRSEYFVDTLKAAHLEREALATSGDLIARVGALARLGEDLDPDWAVDFMSIGGVPTQVLRAKHPNAALVSPITIKPTFRFGPGDEDLKVQAERVFGFGADEELVLPGRVLADLAVEGPSWLTLPSVEESEEIRFLASLPPGEGQEWPPLEVTLHAAGAVKGSHRATITHVRRGSHGMTVQCVVHRLAELKFVLPDDVTAHGELQMSLDLTGASTYDARKAVRFIRDMVGSDQIELMANGTTFGSLRGEVTPERVARADELLWVEEAAGDLLAIEDALGVSLEFRPSLSLFDRIDLRILARLVAGECVLHRDAFRLPVTINDQGEQPELDRFMRGESGALAVTIGDVRWTVLGQTVCLPELSIYHPRTRLVTSTGDAPRRGDECVIEAVDSTPGRLYLPDRADPDRPLVPTEWGLSGIPEPASEDSLLETGGLEVRPRLLGSNR